MPLTLQSTVKLTSGFSMPILGLGDSALIYRNHHEVGQGIKDSGIPREEIFITSKIVSKFQGYEQTLAKVEESLVELNTSYIDLFLIHDPLGGPQKRLDTYRALVKKVSEGKVRSIGVSNYGVKHLEELKAANLGISPCVNQIELHPRCQLRDIVEYCKANYIVIEAYCPLGRGEYLDDPVLTKISSETSKLPAQILIRWSLQSGFCPLPKSAHEARIISNADVYNFELSPDQMQALNDMDQDRAGAVSWGGNIVAWKD